VTREETDNPRHRWHAAFYDRVVGFDHKMGPLRDLIVGGAEGRVLEVGCGTGLSLAHVNWPAVERYDATDPDVHMLQRAREKADALPPELRVKVALQEAPAERLPFADGSFDAVITSLVLCTVVDLDAALAELKRVLVPGGELRLIEHVGGEGFAGGLQAVVQPVYGWFAAGCQLRRDIEGAVRRAGFELEVMRRFSLGPIWPGFAGVATKPA
jgi:ubiquinone/menaquinone biosynthesis C-methylase UbiE